MLPNGHKPTVLAVDDEPQILTALEDLLEDNFTVWTATGAREALRVLQQGPVEVLLSDQRMPDVSGDQLLAEARRVSHAVRILITGYADIEALARAVNDGQIFAYISKPWAPGELQKTVHRAAEAYRGRLDEARQQRLQDSLRAARVGVWSWDPQSGHLLWDESLARLIGVHPGVFPATLDDWLELIHPEDRVPFRQSNRSLAGEGGTYNITCRVRAGREDWRYIHCQASLLGPQEDLPARVSGLCVDITGEIQAHEQLRFALEAQKTHIAQIERQQQEVQRHVQALNRSNEELEEFAYIISHDLKEPLRGIHGYTRIIQEDYSEQIGPEGREALAKVCRLTSRLESLINSLLYYSRVGRDELEFKPVDLNELLSHILEGLRATLDENTVDIRIPRPLPAVLCDSVRIGEVFQNLILNAIKYNDNQEKWIEIGVHGGPGGDPSECILYAKDNGIGIRKGHQQRIFGIFKRLHGRQRYGGGTGVGLTLVKKIVERHGGRIWVESEFGKGSTFFFTLQRALSGPAVPRA